MDPVALIQGVHTGNTGQQERQIDRAMGSRSGGKYLAKLGGIRSAEVGQRFHPCNDDDRARFDPLEPGKNGVQIGLDRIHRLAAQCIVRTGFEHDNRRCLL